MGLLVFLICWRLPLRIDFVSLKTTSSPSKVYLLVLCQCFPSATQTHGSPHWFKIQLDRRLVCIVCIHECSKWVARDGQCYPRMKHRHPSNHSSKTLLIAVISVIISHYDCHMIKTETLGKSLSDRQV